MDPLAASDATVAPPSCIKGAGFGLSTLASTPDAVREAVSVAISKAQEQTQGKNQQAKEASSTSSLSSYSSSSVAVVNDRPECSVTFQQNEQDHPDDAAATTTTTATTTFATFATIAFVSADSSRNFEELRHQFLAALPEGTLIHGVTSTKSLLAPANGGSIPGAVGCLLIYYTSATAAATTVGTSTTATISSGSTDRSFDDGENDVSKTAPNNKKTQNTRHHGRRRCHMQQSHHGVQNRGFATAFCVDADNSDSVTLLVASLKQKMPHPRAILIGTVPGSEEGIIAALHEEFPSVPLWGGTAADNGLEGRWCVLSSTATSSRGASLVAIGRDVAFGAAMIAPYRATTKTGVATKTDGRRVLRIDDQHADDWVYHWLGEDVKAEFEHGGLILDRTCRRAIGIRQPSGEFVTNHLAAFGGQDQWTGFDEWESWVEFFAPIPQGSELVVMEDGDTYYTGYKEAFLETYDTALSTMTRGSTPVAGILILCGGMALATGDRLNVGLTDKQFVSRVKDLPLLGMTCFGEQGYLPKARRSVQRNLSMGMLLFG